MERILVTGGQGNIGSVLIPYLRLIGHDVLSVDVTHDYGDHYFMSDVNNPIDLIELYKDYNLDVVIHMAAKVSRIGCEKSPGLTVQTNLGGLQNIIQLCRINNAKLIYFSTSEVYGNIEGILSEDRDDLNPNNLYGITKLMGEQLVKYHVDNYKLKAVILRPFMIYNEKQNSQENKPAIIRFVHALLQKAEITVHKNTLRSWMNIKDAVTAIERSIHIDNFEIINIGHPKMIKTEALAQKICDTLGLKYKDYVIETDMPSRMTSNKTPDLIKQTEILGFVPNIDIDLGIEMIIDNIKKRKSDD